MIFEIAYKTTDEFQIFDSNLLNIPILLVDASKEGISPSLLAEKILEYEKKYKSFATEYNNRVRSAVELVEISISYIYTISDISKNDEYFYFFKFGNEIKNFIEKKNLEVLSQVFTFAQHHRENAIYDGNRSVLDVSLEEYHNSFTKAEKEFTKKVVL